MDNGEKKSRLKKGFWTGYNLLALLICIVLTGFALNFFWYLFHALVLGWADSAPEWYIDVQERVFFGIFLGAAVLWLGGVWWFVQRTERKQSAKERT